MGAGLTKGGALRGGHFEPQESDVVVGAAGVCEEVADDSEGRQMMLEFLRNKRRERC